MVFNVRSQQGTGRTSVNRSHAAAPIILLASVWLGACEKSEERTPGRSDSGTHTEAAFSDAYGLIHGFGVDSSLPANSGFGTCVDDPQFLTECQAPVTEPAAPALSKPDASETACTVAHHSGASLAVEHSAAAQMANADTAVPAEATLAALPLSKRCDQTDSSTDPAPNADAPATGQVAGCCCGMKPCACG
jgi:hypothetical protein